MYDGIARVVDYDVDFGCVEGLQCSRDKSGPKVGGGCVCLNRNCLNTEAPNLIDDLLYGSSIGAVMYGNLV